MMQRNEVGIDEKYLLEIIGRLSEHLSSEFYSLTESELSRMSELLTAIEPLLGKEPLSQEESIRLFNDFNLGFGDFLANAFPNSDQLDIKNIYREYTKDLEGIVAVLPKKMTVIQEDTRFIPGEGDSLTIIFLKRVKGFARNTQWFFRKISNVFRKTKLGIPTWKQSVSVRQIFRYSLRNVLLHELFPLFRTTLGKNNEVHYRILEMVDIMSHWFFIDRMDSDPKIQAKDILVQFETALKESKVEIKTAQSRLKEEIDESGKRALDKYLQLEKISGTVEYSDRKSSARKVNRHFTKLNAELTSIIHYYGNTSYYIFDDWRFDTSINQFSSTLLTEEQKVLRNMEKKFNSDVKKFTEGYADLLKETESYISTKGSSVTSLKRINKEFKSGFASLLIKSLSDLKSGSIPARLRSISRTLSIEVNSFAETKAYAKKFNRSAGIANKDLVQIRPVNILRFDILPEIELSLTKLASETQEKFDSLLNHMSEIGTIAEFSIDSAIKQIQDKHEGEKNPMETLMEGLARSEEKAKAILVVFTELKLLVDQKMAAIVRDQIGEIQSLRENDKIFILNMRLARVLLKKRAKESFLLFIRKLRTVVQKILIGPLKIVNVTYQQIRNTYGRFVTIAAPEAISGKLSAFLSESKNAIARLPYIYQRLYLIEPISDDLYYYRRDKENEQLKKAIEYWENKHYSPVAILCEKGSGGTSFINQFRKNYNKYPSVQIAALTQIYSKDDFISFIGSQLKLKGKDFETIVTELNNSEERIIILEDLQKLYLRTVDGFNALKTLFTLMSLTNEKILWVTSCTRYAWEYLDLTLNISGYFNSLIYLTQLNDAAIRELILKRHVISGYNITYYPNVVQENSRQYKKLPAKEKQTYLEERYFYNINKFAKGNISLALHFWVRSTKEVQDKQIIISSLYDADYRFLNTMNTNHMVILTMICLHDGITSQHVSLITRKSIDESERALNMLFDDSIIVKKGNYYLINPLLYRQVIEFLKNKNFIH